MTTKRDELLLWLDLETTGLNPDRDEIVEVGVIATTTDLIELDEYDAVVEPSAAAAIRMMTDDTVHEMHDESGLIAALAAGNGKQLHRVERVILAILDNHPADRVILAGTNVDGFDRRFLRRWMPVLAERLHYRGFDAGTLASAAGWWSEPVPFASVRPHRALSDARAALAVARTIRGHYLPDGDR